MSQAELLLTCVMAPLTISVLVGQFFLYRLRRELDDAMSLARRTYRELDEARYVLDEVQDTLDRAEDDPPITDELPTCDPSPTPQPSGRHRLWE